MQIYLYKYICICTEIVIQLSNMSMNLLKKIRAKQNLKNYGLAKKLNELGIKVTIPGVDGYDKINAKSMRLDVLCGLRRISGENWAEFGKWLDEEFLIKK